MHHDARLREAAHVAISGSDGPETGPSQAPGSNRGPATSVICT